MQETFLKELLARDEDERTEFKLAYHLDKEKLKNELAKDVLALANAAGRNSKDYAYLIIGAGNERDMHGKRPAKDVRACGYSATRFLDIVNSRCTPPLHLTYELIEFDCSTYGVITVLPSPEIHYLIKDIETPKGFWRKHCVLTRIGDQVQVAPPRELLRMDHEKQQWGKPTLNSIPALVHNSVDSKDTELKKKEVPRRAFIRWLALVGTTGLIAKVADVEGMFQFSNRIQKYMDYDPDADQERLKRLFGVQSGSSGALLPAGDHPFKPLPTGEYYPTESQNCAAYRERFLKNIVLRTVNGFPKVKPDDSLVLFGSQVSNLNSRLLFGNPFNLEQPKLEITEQERGWRARLRWNLYTPFNAQELKRQQFGAPWVTWNHIIGGPEGEKYESVHHDDVLEDDYLLITVLPRFAKGDQRIIVFAGCHGPGQKAATLLLRKAPNKQLQALEHKIVREPFYQALFHVDLARDNEGEFVPKQIDLIDAHSLDLEFSRT